MRRRLDLAASLIADPPVIFLDEPTTGLDPAARRELWDVIRELVAGGTTVLLTTQYLEEADALADDIVVLDHGRADRARLAGGAEGADRRRAARGRRRDRGRRSSRRPTALRAVRRGRGRRSMPRRAASSCRCAGATRLVDVVRALDAAGVDAVDVQRREPTLDDVFLTLTGAPSAERELEEVAA